MAKVRVATPRFYVDADTLGLAKVLVQVRPDVTYPGDSGGVTVDKRIRPPCPVMSPEVDDEIWLPEVARNQWLVINRDKKIQRRPGEIQAVLDHGVKMAAITSDENLSVFEQLEVVMVSWRRLEELTQLPGPFIYAMTRSGFRKVA